MSAHSPAIVALVRVEWEGINTQQEPCCPECHAPLYGKNSAATKYALEEAKHPRLPWQPLPRPYHTLEPGHHFTSCMLDQALCTQADLQTPQSREILRRISYTIEGKGIQDYIEL